MNRREALLGAVGLAVTPALPVPTVAEPVTLTVKGSAIGPVFRLNTDYTPQAGETWKLGDKLTISGSHGHDGTYRLKSFVNLS